MPNFPTVEAAQTWCAKAFPADTAVTQTSHWSFHMPWLSLIGYGLVAFVAFEVGHYGVAAIYTWIKSKLTKTSTVSTTVVTATPAA